MGNRCGALFGAVLAVSLAVAAEPADAFRIELVDVAPDRIERQREAALGNLPLPGTPNIAQFGERLKAGGFDVGTPVLIRIFKEQSELEVWLRKGPRYELFATYPICYWSGTLGPKISEGDKQSPEGVYHVTQRQLHYSGRHPRSLNLGFPNTLDAHHKRTGTYLLVHGECSSIGCYAMTNTVIEEIFRLTQAALKAGQDAVPVHVFPFRPTDENFARHAASSWVPFWRNLQTVHDSFERTRVPPKVSVCDGNYWVEDRASIPETQSPPVFRRLRRVALDRHLERTEACKAPSGATAKVEPMKPSVADVASVSTPSPPAAATPVVAPVVVTSRLMTAPITQTPSAPEPRATPPLATSSVPTRTRIVTLPRPDRTVVEVTRSRPSERVIIERVERVERTARAPRVEQIIETPAPRRSRAVVTEERPRPRAAVRRASTPAEPTLKPITDMDFAGTR